MTFIVKQKIKGKIYLYRAESYWAKEKKQLRQKRTYIGPEEPTNKMYKKNWEFESSQLNKHAKNTVHKNFGDIVFLSFLINESTPKSSFSSLRPRGTKRKTISTYLLSML